jgi:transposase
MTNPLVVGVDPHPATNTSAFMDAYGRELARRCTLPNNRPGTEAFVQQLVHLAADGNFDAIVIATEATGWCWWHFFQTLDHHPLLQQLPLDLYALNPRLTATFSKTYGDADHTDRSDAAMIADRLRLGRDLPAPFACDERYLPLRLLTRYRCHLLHALVREKAYFLAILYLKASEYARLKPFSDLFGVTSRAVIQDFSSLEEIAALPLSDLAAWIDERGRHNFPDPEANARKLQQVARDSYVLPDALQAPVNLILRLSLQTMDGMERHVKRLDTAIAEQVAQFPQPLESIPGIGPVFAAGISSEIGDIRRFDADEAKVAKYAGFKWRQHQSGQFVAEETPLTKRGNAYLRYYLCEAANAVRMHTAEYHAYYDRKYHEVRQHQHKRALVLTARKLVRLVVRLLATNQPYQPRRPTIA